MMTIESPGAFWKDYELIDCSCGERLERWGNITLIRPDPQVIWKTEKKNPLWKKADAVYHRSQSGGGQWEIRNKLYHIEIIQRPFLALCKCSMVCHLIMRHENVCHVFHGVDHFSRPV